MNKAFKEAIAELHEMWGELSESSLEQAEVEARKYLPYILEQDHFPGARVIQKVTDETVHYIFDQLNAHHNLDDQKVRDFILKQLKSRSTKENDTGEISK